MCETFGVFVYVRHVHMISLSTDIISYAKSICNIQKCQNSTSRTRGALYNNKFNLYTGKTVVHYVHHNHLVFSESRIL